MYLHEPIRASAKARFRCADQSVLFEMNDFEILLTFGDIKN